MKRITIILKPTSECNFRCSYCYHADTNYERGRMSIELFEEIIQKAVSDYNDIVLIFHGGEPLLMGYDFFVKAIDIINKYTTKNKSIKLGIQTNGFLLDDKFCNLFQANGILPAISFDGPGELNCLRDKTEVVTKRIVELKSKGYSLNLLGVITKKNLFNLKECHDFAKANHCHYKMNPVFESGGAKEENNYMVSSREYIDALKAFLPIWLSDETAISDFEPISSLVYMAFTKNGRGCTACGCLTKWVSIHHDGTLYPCGRSYPDEYCLGRIQDINTLSLAFNDPNFEKLIKGAIQRRNNCYHTCSYYSICQGGCNNDSLLKGDITKPSGFWCNVYKEMIPFIQEYCQNNLDNITNVYVVELLKRCDYGKHND